MRIKIPYTKKYLLITLTETNKICYQVPEFITKTVTDSYEAAYYLASGGKLKNVEIRRRRNNKKGYIYDWIITIEGINKVCIQNYEQGKAKCNVRELASHRMKLKNFINKNS